ncbi:MAG TPA: glycine cleavage system aminomethyltransferase GcvT [Thermohalobaculum sp.]|nr:glycine cleavage system aminomethyltransferase GcvT [Thermohalobaculum sp.]
MDETAALRKTPLHDLHVELGATMVGFAGYEMPVQYRTGVLNEHRRTRNACGLFDVSHMGQVVLRPRSRTLADAARALERLVPANVVGLKPGRQRYGLLTNEEGGIIDDLMIAALDDHLLLVVNAARKADDVAHLRKQLSDTCEVEELTSRALIAVQGPRALDALGPLAPEVEDMRFMDVVTVEVADVPCIVSRSGYTGEDGFEISIPDDRAVEIARSLLGYRAVGPVGLGARDSLRLEAGLCLYGNDIDMKTTPVEAALEWAIPKVRRRGGEREGGFPGARRILDELEQGTARRRVGLKPRGKAPVREGAQLYAEEEGGEPVGRVTSGSFGPSVGGPVSMGYLPTEMAEPGTGLFAEVRKKRLPIDVHALPFRDARYEKD